MLSARRRFAQLVCISLLVLASIGVMIGFSPHASAETYSGPTLRLPWLYGNYPISGYTYNCGDHTGKDQFAIDFGLPEGTPVTAVFRGTVGGVGTPDPAGYGNYLWVSFGNYRAIYAHLSQINVTNGQQVYQGQVLGLSGHTGHVIPADFQGAHLHFSLRDGGTGPYDGAAVVPEPMSGYTGFGNTSTCVGNGNWYNPSPGGWWIGPTPNDYCPIPSSSPNCTTSSQIQVNFRMVDNSLATQGTILNNGLDHGVITYWDSCSNAWHTVPSQNVTTTFYTSGEADVYTVLNMPNCDFEVSVNVYALNGSKQLAPSGIRHYCLPSQAVLNSQGYYMCPTDKHLFPSGGSSSTGGGSGGLSTYVFEDFSGGIGNWWTNGNVAGVTSGPDTYMSFTPAAQTSAEANKSVGVPALSAYNTIMVQINLHGSTLLGNDASALYLNQGGSWKYVSLSNYVQQGLDGWQTVTVPLGAFQGFDQTSSFDSLGFRFWVSSNSTIDVGTILFSLNETATQPYTIYDESLAANWGDWSWCSNNNLADTSHPLTGSHDISWTVTCSYGGLALHLPSGFNTSTYAAITFALEASQSGQTVQVSFYDSSGNTGQPVQLSSYGGTPVTGQYTVYTIPISAFHSTGTITGFLIQDITGGTEPPMYVDTIQII